MPTLQLTIDYLSNRKERTKIENIYSTWLGIIFGFPQGSILGLLLFNVFLSDLFFTVNDMDIASYVDGNTPYMIADNVDDFITSFEQASNGLFERFKNISWLISLLWNHNSYKIHFIIYHNSKNIVV